MPHTPSPFCAAPVYSLHRPFARFAVELVEKLVGPSATGIGRGLQDRQIRAHFRHHKFFARPRRSPHFHFKRQRHLCPVDQPMLIGQIAKVFFEFGGELVVVDLLEQVDGNGPSYWLEDRILGRQV